MSVACYREPQGSESSVTSSTASRPAKTQKASRQQSVDTFWRNFNTRFPGTVLSVLPSDTFAKKKALASTKGTVTGKSAIKSYEQAAADCRLAVQKIAKECRRVNLKYRDHHFDIDFDLKAGPRDCLDALGSSNRRDRKQPKSVKRVSDVFSKPQFYIDDASASDVRQGRNGDCWFLSAISAISNKKNLVDKVCVDRDEAVGVYGFVFNRDGEWFHTVIDDKLYLTAPDWWEALPKEKQAFEDTSNPQDAERKYRETVQRGSGALYFAQCREENETWLPLLEKAFAKAHGDYDSIDGGFTGEAIEDLTGGVTTELFATDILDREKFWRDEILKVNEKFLFSCATGQFDKWQDLEAESCSDARGGIVSSHAYSIMDAVEKKGHRLLKVRNPWASDEWRGRWSDGSEEWTPEWMQILNHRFGDDGMFWISYEDLLEKFSHFERTRLFDDTWIITQQWTTVDVPYSADYNATKFQVVLSKESPAVLVLSQLDDRYFTGMRGEYQFQLHFRLDKDGEDDYIVRSHGNYCMSRSVSVDLSSLEAGTYCVLMKIKADRSYDRGVPEKVLRRFANDRPDKVIQIGLSYDLAHAKGEIVETEDEKSAKAKREEQVKADAKAKERQNLSQRRRKQWEFKKRLRAREKRHEKRREDHAQKKIQKSKAGNGHGPAGDSLTVNGPEDGRETQPLPEADNPPVQPPELQKVEAANEESGNKQQPTTTSESQENLPSLALNGDLGTTNSVEANSAPPSTISSHHGADDDFLYDSDASYHSSIDSLLDFAPARAIADPKVPGSVATATEAEDSDVEFASDPWNAVCVVGLKVYSKDENCSIKVVRPRKEDDATLEVDDVSKGVSQVDMGNKDAA